MNRGEFEREYRQHNALLVKQEYRRFVAFSAVVGFAIGVVSSLTIVSFIVVT